MNTTVGTQKGGNMEVEVIKANNPFDESSKIRKIDRLRVAAYCRVSTDDEDQIKSYNSMVKYYTDLIQNISSGYLQVYMRIKLLQEQRWTKEKIFSV